MKKLLVALLAATFVAALHPAAASATPGFLTVTQWDGAPFIDYFPTSATIDAEKAYAASTAPSSTYLYGADPSFIYFDMGSNIYQFTGTLNVAVDGYYGFELYADDAARITIDGVDIAEATFYGGGTNLPYYSTLSLTAGAHAFSLFAYQTVGGEYLESLIGGNGPLSFDSDSPAAVPEPAMLGLFGLGAIGLGLSRRRKV